MEFRRKLLLLILCMTAANSLPNLFDDSDNNDLNSDSSFSPGLGLLDIGSSEPQDFTDFYATDNEFPSYSDNIVLADPGLDVVTTSSLQDPTADELSGLTTSLEYGDTLRSLPAAEGNVELAMDDFCPLGYWNRCCHHGYCFWGVSPRVQLKWFIIMIIQRLLKL